MEDCDRGESEWRGAGGPVHVMTRYKPHALIAAMQEACTADDPRRDAMPRKLLGRPDAREHRQDSSTTTSTSSGAAALGYASPTRSRCASTCLWDLTVRADLDALAASVELMREVGRQPVLATWSAGELYPGPEVRTREEVRDYVRRSVGSYHHQVGTCKMGQDDHAVVDPELPATRTRRRS
jgi:choline dehydrogenase-like flavoprotein